MPSIPQSLLWISLVVLWLFVLVPMLINKRDAVRRTSDIALATRVLTSGASARLLKRGGPAAGHRSDPHWQPAVDAFEEPGEDCSAGSGTAVIVATAGERAEPDYLDVDVVDESSGELPVADVQAAEPESPSGVSEPQPDEVPGDDADAECRTDDDDAEPADDSGDSGASGDVDDAGEGAGEYEYVEDTSGLEAEEEPAATASSAVSTPMAARRRRQELSAAAAVTARKYTFRKRVLMTMALILVGSAAMAFTVASSAWWFCGITTGVTVLYLAYLRRQTRIEEQVRTRRMQRMARSRRGVDNIHEREFDVVPSRLRRPGAAVLEIDDEDPAFEHLGYTAFARDYDWRHHLPRAAGQ